MWKFSLFVDHFLHGKALVSTSPRDLAGEIVFFCQNLREPPKTLVLRRIPIT